MQQGAIFTTKRKESRSHLTYEIDRPMCRTLILGTSTVLLWANPLKEMWGSLGSCREIDTYIGKINTFNESSLNRILT
jgi:hypothetical protein